MMTHDGVEEGKTMGHNIAAYLRLVWFELDRSSQVF